MRQIIFLSKHPKEMKTHTIRPSQGYLGFIVDDQFVVKPVCHKIRIICLNKGPKKPEEYKDYIINDRNKDWNSYKLLSENIMCNEHIYIDIVSEGRNEIYMRGFITNILKSDLNFIEKYMGSPNGIRKTKTTEENIHEYIKSVFGNCYRDIFREDFYKEFYEIYGIDLFWERIYLDPYNRTFTIDLSDIPLKNEFDQLIKANVDSIKKILFPNDITEDLKYSIF